MPRPAAYLDLVTVAALPCPARPCPAPALFLRPSSTASPHRKWNTPTLGARVSSSQEAHQHLLLCFQHRPHRPPANHPTPACPSPAAVSPRKHYITRVLPLPPVLLLLLYPCYTIYRTVRVQYPGVAPPLACPDRHLLQAHPDILFPHINEKMSFNPVPLFHLPFAQAFARHSLPHQLIIAHIPSSCYRAPHRVLQIASSIATMTL